MNLKILVIVAFVVLMIIISYFFVPNIFVPSESQSDSADEPKPRFASSSRHEIKNDQYERFILANKTTENYLLQMLSEFGELSGNDAYRLHRFDFGKTGDWYIIKVGKSIDFYTYHNLVAWFEGYEENPDTPQYSIGFSQCNGDSELDYVFYLDSSISTGDTEIGVFRNGDNLSIYVPESYEPNGNLRVTNETDITMAETVQFLLDNGLDILTIGSLEFEEHEIKMND